MHGPRAMDPAAIAAQAMARPHSAEASTLRITAAASSARPQTTVTFPCQEEKPETLTENGSGPTRKPIFTHDSHAARSITAPAAPPTGEAYRSSPFRSIRL